MNEQTLAPSCEPESYEMERWPGAPKIVPQNPPKTYRDTKAKSRRKSKLKRKQRKHEKCLS